MAIVIRLAVVAVLLVGPYTDEPAELSGWDAERFQEIADRTTPAWADQPIEYPPGSVAVFDVIAGDDVVATNRMIIVLSAAAEAVGVVVLARFFGARAAKAFLVLGLPLVPMGLLRLDMLVTVLAIVGTAALLAKRSHDRPPDGPDVRSGLFAVLVVAGALLKLWPGLLIIGALGVGRRLAAGLAVALGAIAGIGWLLAVGAGLDPLDQILSLRGAEGWHVESLPGALVALFGNEPPRLELNAFRIGTISEPLVLGGRVLTLGAMAALAMVAARRGTGAHSPVRRFALVMLGSVAALLATAPLLSPQFLLWLTPWAALLFATDHSSRSASSDASSSAFGAEPALWLTTAAVTLTGATLTIFGPAQLDAALPAFVLTIRNLLLLALPVVCAVQLRSELGER